MDEVNKTIDLGGGLVKYRIDPEFVLPLGALVEAISIRTSLIDKLSMELGLSCAPPSKDYSYSPLLVIFLGYCLQGIYARRQLSSGDYTIDTQGDADVLIERYRQLIAPVIRRDHLDAYDDAPSSITSLDEWVSCLRIGMSPEDIIALCKVPKYQDYWDQAVWQFARGYSVRQIEAVYAMMDRPVEFDWVGVIGRNRRNMPREFLSEAIDLEIFQFPTLRRAEYLEEGTEWIWEIYDKYGYIPYPGILKLKDADLPDDLPLDWVLTYVENLGD